MPIFSAQEIGRRHDALRGRTRGCDAIVATSFFASYYLSGVPIIPRTIEVTRLGMGKGEMVAIAELILRLLVHKEDVNAVLRDVADLRGGFQTLDYCFDTGLPP
jgi:hypothetical protein